MREKELVTHARSIEEPRQKAQCTGRREIQIGTAIMTGIAKCLANTVISAINAQHDPLPFAHAGVARP